MNILVSHRLLLGAIFCSAALLLLSGSWFCYTSTFDTATVGLMSVNILEGDRPLFFYGQPYFGALEAYLAALFLSIFGFSEFVISLSPISFTLAWILFSYLLFTRIHNRITGLVAAACVAFPGYYVFWYAISTYGGYPAILCIGTAILWLALRIFQEKSDGTPLVFQCLLLGLLMALGIWIHALIFPYIVIAAVLLVLYLWQKHFRLSVFLALSLSAVIGFTGFIPFYMETGAFMGGVSESVQLSLVFISDALVNLFAGNMYELIVWNFIHSFDSAIVRFSIVYGSIAILVAACMLAFISLFGKKHTLIEKKYYVVPLSFCLLFLLMYVQHHMATIRAPRYAINFWSLLLCIVWSLAITGQKRVFLKRFSFILFGFWITYQILGTVFFIVANSSGAREEQKTMEMIVQTAQKNNLTSVVTFGDSLFGYEAQKLSMFSGNTIPFANAGHERCRENAQFTERDPNKGYITNAEYEKKLQNGLTAAGVSYTISRIKDYYLFSDLHSDDLTSMEVIPVTEMRSLGSSKLKNTVNGELLLDRSQDVSLLFADDAENFISFDTGKLRMFSGIWLFSSQISWNPQWQAGLHFEVSVSRDNVHYEKVYTSTPRSANILHAGSHVYISGPRGKSEALFAPVMGRYIRVFFPKHVNPPVTELFVFQKKKRDPQTGVDDIVRMQNIIKEQDLDFVLADRWVSANLRDVFKGTNKAEIALSRYSLRYKKDLLKYYVKAEQGQALVCDIAVADACDRITKDQFGDSVISERIDLTDYTVFILADPGKKKSLTGHSALIWNGHVPLQTHNMDLLAPVLNAQGAPVWMVDFTSTKGFYRDSWSNGDGQLFHLNYTIQLGKDKELVMYTHGWRPGTLADLNIKLLANKKISLQFLRKKGAVYYFSLPESLSHLDSLQIQSTIFIPPGADSRELGMDVKRIEIQ